MQIQILLNELSLSGQFPDHGVFLKTGLLPMIAVLKEMQALSVLLLLKKSDVWNRMVTPNTTLHAMLVSGEFRKTDEARRLKSAIDWLTHEPFWDTDAKQHAHCAYLFEGSDIAGSSVAEACERDKVIASFLESALSANPLEIIKNGTAIPLQNISKTGELTEMLWVQQRISFETYAKSRFSGAKLDFTQMDGRMGFAVVQSDEQALFIDAFRKFIALSWEQIHKDQGFNYKQYHGVLSAAVTGTTCKFRVSQKMRCHGYRKDDTFVVIGFETDHSLSDKG